MCHQCNGCQSTLFGNLANAIGNLFSCGNNGCGCNGFGNGVQPVNGCGCNGGCGCGYDDYYARQYALYPYNMGNTNGICSCF